MPRAIRILGEDLVAFGISQVKSEFCIAIARIEAHRWSSVSSGNGDRCCYHGFHWNVDGTLLDVPGEPDRGKRMSKVGQGAYPAFERFGMVFAYMGSYDEMPEFQSGVLSHLR